MWSPETWNKRGSRRSWGTGRGGGLPATTTTVTAAVGCPRPRPRPAAARLRAPTPSPLCATRGPLAGGASAAPGRRASCAAWSVAAPPRAYLAPLTLAVPPAFPEIPVDQYPSGIGSRGPLVTMLPRVACAHRVCWLASAGAADSASAGAQVPLTFVSGFLGSGKTTMLKYVLENQDGKRVGVVSADAVPRRCLTRVCVPVARERCRGRQP